MVSGCIALECKKDQSSSHGLQCRIPEHHTSNMWLDKVVPAVMCVARPLDNFVACLKRPMQMHCK